METLHEVGAIVDDQNNIIQIQYDPNDTNVKINKILLITKEELELIKDERLKPEDVIGLVSDRINSRLNTKESLN